MLTHVNPSNRPTMVDVGDKAVTTRIARARAVVTFPQEALGSKLDSLQTKKGPVVDTAIVAGVLAAKQTHNLIPFCHPIPPGGLHDRGGLERGAGTRHRMFGARDPQDGCRDGSPDRRCDRGADRLRHVQVAVSRYPHS